MRANLERHHSVNAAAHWGCEATNDLNLASPNDDDATPVEFSPSSVMFDGAGRGEVLVLVLALGLLVELELARAATHFCQRGRVLIYAATTPRIRA